LPIEGVQRLELLLTGAQSLFAVALIVNLRMSIREAWWIFALFWAQFIASAAAGRSCTTRC
jgi:cation:H+ antiporter